jgi:hypothetical protein
MARKKKPLLGYWVSVDNRTNGDMVTASIPVQAPNTRAAMRQALKTVIITENTVCLTIERRTAQ